MKRQLDATRVIGGATSGPERPDGDDFAEAIVDAVRVVALGPDQQRVASAYPLSARGYSNESYFWWGKDAAKAKNRPGNPTIQVELNCNMIVTVMCSKKGKNPIVFVTSGTEVVLLEDNS